MNDDDPTIDAPPDATGLPTPGASTAGTNTHQSTGRGGVLGSRIVLGSYRLVQLLGAGGFGEAWEAESTDTKRRLALKVLTQARSATPELIERFKREGKLAASVNHPRCVFVFGADEIEGYPIITMELMTGGTLQDRIDKSGPALPREAVDVILDLIEGLQACQEAGILHRDIKPSNCFVDERGRCKIGDFGISKSLDAPVDLTLLTRAGGFIGTPSYASPEQVRGREVDFRSDIYSVGATLYALLTGKPPFHGARPAEVLARIVAEEPPPFSSYRVQIPKGLERVIRRAMAKDKEKRYSSYLQLRVALLPYSSSGLTAGSLLKRFLAFQVDNVLLSVAVLPLGYVFFRDAVLGFPVALRAGLVFAYFVFTEKIGGRSFGKYLFGLRVTTAKGTPVTWRNILLRTFILAASAFSTVGIYWFVNSQLRGYLVLLPWALILMTMRSRNGYAGLHELLSGTRVVTPKRRAVLSIPKLDFPPEESPSCQQNRYGPYRVAETLWRDGMEALYAGHDELLNRTVWIHEFPAAHSRPMVAFTAIRPGRLRWFQGSREGEMNWDAYEAPSGISFYQWVSRVGKLSWAEMREIVLGMATELNARTRESEYERKLSVRNLWIDSHGDTKLLDFPSPPNVTEAAGFAEFNSEEWNSFIHEILYFGLTGNHTSKTFPGAAMPPTPLPAYTRDLVARICGLSESFTSLASLITELRRTADRPAHVTRMRRIGPAAVVSVPFLILGVMLMAVFLAPLLSPLILGPRPWLRDFFLLSPYRRQIRMMESAQAEWLRKDVAIREVMANSYTNAVTTREGRDAIAELAPHVRQDLESAAREFPQLSEPVFVDAQRVAKWTRLSSSTSPPPNDSRQWMGELLQTTQLRVELWRLASAANQNEAQVKAAEIRKVMANSYAQATRQIPERTLESLIPMDDRWELESAARDYPHLLDAEVEKARHAIPNANEITREAFAELGVPRPIDNKFPLWRQDLARSPEYWMERLFLKRALGQAQMRIDAIQKITAHIYTLGQTTSDVQQVLVGLPPDLKQVLAAAAKRFPNVTEAELREARLLSPQTGGLGSVRSALLRALPGMAVAFGLGMALLALLFTAILETGPLFRIFGMSQQTRDGRKAGRLRCILRTAMAWAPFLAGPILFFFSKTTLVSNEAEVVYAAILGAALVGFVQSFIWPERGIPELISGVCIVPR